jgi:hypothetical protein
MYIPNNQIRIEVQLDWSHWFTFWSTACAAIVSMDAILRFFVYWIIAFLLSVTLEYGRYVFAVLNQGLKNWFKAIVYGSLRKNRNMGNDDMISTTSLHYESLEHIYTIYNVFWKKSNENIKSRFLITSIHSWSIKYNRINLSKDDSQRSTGHWRIVLVFRKRMY